ncbi:phage tail tape measure protein [Dyadobacter jiangsuensis]
MNTIEKSTVQLIIDGQQSKVSMKELGVTVKTLKKELREMKEADDPKLFAEKEKQLKAASAAYQEAQTRVRALTSEGQRFKSAWKDVFKGFLGGSAVTYGLELLSTGLTKVKDKIYSMADSLADVSKATDLSAKDVRKLNSELGALDTRTATEDLRQMSIIAGKNGIQKDIAGFVKSTDMINIALGDEFDNVQQLTESVINLRKIFLDVKSDDIEADVLHIGNAINFLTDKGTASAKVMTDFASRMGGVLIPLGVTTGQVLGLSAALEELSVSPERGATAINTIFQKMLTGVEDFAKVAGMKATDFANLLNTDIWAAFNQFVIGAQKGGAQATEFAKILADTELSGSGASEVILKLASNQDLLTERVKQGTEQLSQSGSIVAEVAKKNNNAAAIIDKFGKIAENAYERMAMAIGDVIETVGPWLLQMGNLSSVLKDHWLILQTIATATAIYYLNVVKATAATALSTTAQIANRIAVAASVPIYSLAGTGLRLMTIGHQLLTGQISLSTAATRVFSMATKSLHALWLANPLGIVIAGLSAAVAALKLYSDNTAEAIALEKAKHKLELDLAKATQENEKAMALLNMQVANYNNLSEDEQANLQKELVLRRQKLAAQLKSIEAQKVELTQMAAAPTIWQKFMALIQSGGNGVNFATNVGQAVADSMQEINDQFDAQINALKDGVKEYDDMAKKIRQIELAPRRERRRKLGEAANSDPKLGGDDKDKPDKVKEEGKSMFTQRHEFEMAEEEYDKKRADQKKEWAEAEAEYDQKKLDDLKSYMEAEREYDKMMAEREAKANYNTTANTLDMAEATGQITPEAANLAKLDAEEAYMIELYNIRKTYGEETADLEQAMAEASIERARRVTDAERANVEQQRQLALNLQTVKMEALEQGVAALKSYFKETSAVYKALFLVEKAAAIANVIIKSQAEIAATSAYAATLGPVAGPAYAAAMIAATKIRTGISIATIASQAVQAFVPGREEGGFTDINSLQRSKKPAGYVSQPTLFNLGQRSFIAGENYKKEYVIPSTMLRDPYFAAQAEQMEMFRTTGRHPLAAAGGGGEPARSNVDGLLLMLIEESKQTRIALQSGSIGVKFNTTAFEEYQGFINYIRDNTSL